jgi:hypothetical protein
LRRLQRFVDERYPPVTDVALAGDLRLMFRR